MVCDLTEYYLGQLIAGGRDKGADKAPRAMVERAAEFAANMMQFRNQVMGDAVKADQAEGLAAAVSGDSENAPDTTTLDEARASLATEPAPALDAEADQG